MCVCVCVCLRACAHKSMFPWMSDGTFGTSVEVNNFKCWSLFSPCLPCALLWVKSYLYHGVLRILLFLPPILGNLIWLITCSYIGLHGGLGIHSLAFMLLHISCCTKFYINWATQLHSLINANHFYHSILQC